MLQAIELSKTYQNNVALNNVSFDVNRGEVFCLLGQNGAGKTTTINIFLGFIEASGGRALINNIDITRDPAGSRQRIAYIPEVVQLYGNLTGIENLAFFSRLAGFSYTDAELRQFLTAANLQEDAQSRRLAGYSKGMRQKVAIAIALSKDADVIFMDEPTSGLDPRATAEFTTLCKDFVAGGKSIFMATHDIFNAVNVGTRIGIMNRGTLVHDLLTSNINANQLQQLYLETI